MIDDRMTRGVLAGVCGALVQNIYMYTAKTIGLTDIMYVDIARHFLFTQDYNGFIAVLVGLLGQLSIDSLWGVIFAFLIAHTSGKFYLLKGISFGTLLWFFIRVFGTKIFGVTPGTPPVTALVYFIGASLFGLTLAIVLKLLDTEEKKVY